MTPGARAPYLTKELRAGDELELRGPIGGYFVWEPGDGGPLMLLAGGSGVVPLRSILRHRQRTGSDVPARLLYSARMLLDVIYRDELRVGDALELRGPIGGYFVWEPGDGSPLTLLAGGSGIVPLRSILRHRLDTGSDVPARLLYSSRTLPDVIYRDELDQHHDGVQVSYTLTRSQPAGWTGYTGRINQALLTEVAWPAEARPLAYICGPTSFVETAASGLVALGYPPERVKTERFGATGGH